MSYKPCEIIICVKLNVLVDIIHAMQVLHLVGDGYRLSPPPGCPKAIYMLMTNCW